MSSLLVYSCLQCKSLSLFLFSFLFLVHMMNVLTMAMTTIYIICRPTFIKIWKAKSVQDFKPDPYVVTILNCAMWSFYGMPFVSKNNILVLTINGFGFFLEIFYTGIFFAFSTWSKRVRNKPKLEPT